jgi:hypothetical protein
MPRMRASMAIRVVTVAVGVTIALVCFGWDPGRARRPRRGTARRRGSPA